MDINIATSYTMKKGVVDKVTWADGDGSTCVATVDKDNPSEYVYTSKLAGDRKKIVSPRKMSLADCTLAANVHLGLIPARNFEPIACSNKH